MKNYVWIVEQLWQRKWVPRINDTNTTKKLALQCMSNLKDIFKKNGTKFRVTKYISE